MWIKEREHIVCMKNGDEQCDALQQLFNGRKLQLQYKLQHSQISCNIKFHV